MVEPNDGPAEVIVTLWSDSVNSKAQAKRVPGFVMGGVGLLFPLSTETAAFFAQRTLSRASSNSEN